MLLERDGRDVSVADRPLVHVGGCLECVCVPWEERRLTVDRSRGRPEQVKRCQTLKKNPDNAIEQCAISVFSVE